MIEKCHLSWFVCCVDKIDNSELKSVFIFHYFLFVISSDKSSSDDLI